MGVIVLAVGVIGLGAVVGAVVVFAVLRSRRNSDTQPVTPGAGTYPQNMGYPPQQHVPPAGQQQYPPTPYQGYPTPPPPGQ